MTLITTIIYLVLSVTFSAIGYCKDMKTNGKLSTGTIVIITFFCALLLTGITNALVQNASSSNDKKEINTKIDSATEKLDKKIDTVLRKLSN